MLKHIKTIKCPECGCTNIEKESWHGSHSNGQRWENRTFTCGKSIDYIPNFQREEEKDGCKLSIDYLARREDRICFAQNLRKYIEGYRPLDEGFRETALNKIDWLGRLIGAWN